MLHSSYTLWQHDQQTKCRKPVGARGCGGCRRTACQALELLGLTRSRSKFSFLIRRWGNQVQTLFLCNPFLRQIYFLHEPLGFKFFPKSLGGLTTDVQSYLWPLPGARAVVCLFQKVLAALEESKNAVSIPSWPRCYR